MPLVTTVAGNTGIDSVTTNAQLLLPLFGADASTVLAKGAAKPLKRNTETAEDFHGPDGLGGVRDSVAKQIAKPSAVKANGIKRIVEAAKHYGKDLTIVALGPLTNIARATRMNARCVASGRSSLWAARCGLRNTVPEQSSTSLPIPMRQRL